MVNTVEYHEYIDRLTESQQRRLLDDLTHRLGNVGSVSKRGGKPANDYSHDERMVFEVTAKAISNGYGVPPMDPIINSAGIGYANYRAQVVALNDYITHGCSVQLSPARRRGITQRVIGCLVQHLAARQKTPIGWGVPTTAISIRDVMRPTNFGLLPSAVERQFPGYVGARLLHLIAPRNGSENRLI